MYYLVIIFVFIFGLVLGSFVNALEYRISEGLSINGRSFCPNCKHQLVWYDLVPVFSWLSLSGKCRYCKKQISAQYPLIELLSALSLLFLSYHFGLLKTVISITVTSQIWFSLVGFVLISILSTLFILIALHDYKTGYVLSYYTYFAIAVALLLVSFSSGSFVGWNTLLTYLYSAAGSAAPFAIIWGISKGKWMGAGDIEVALLLGLILGWPAVLVGLYFAFIIGSLVGLALIASKKTELKSHIAFGPFLIGGIYFGLAFGQQLADIYARMFLGF